MILSLALPTIVLMIAAVVVTRLVERRLPETLAGLALTGAISAFVMWGLSGGLFGWLYVARETGLARALGTQSGLVHLAGLGAKSALIWGPLVLITVATAPRRWRTNIW